MKIAVIGASGRSGQEFLAQALAAGHLVRAGVRKPNRLVPQTNLQVMQCEVTEESELESLLEGQEAVVSLIGHDKNSPPFLQTDLMKKLIKLMPGHGISRIISLTGTGVRLRGDKIRFLDRLLNLAIRLIDPQRVEDGIHHLKVLQHSNLDWTVIRVLKLTSGQPTTYVLTEHGPGKPLVARQEVARALLQVLEQNSFVRKAPILAKPVRKRHNNNN